MIETIDSLYPSVASLPGTTNGAVGGAHALAVLAELDRRYDPAPWQQQVRRYGAVVAALALMVIAIAGTAALVTSRRRAG